MKKVMSGHLVGFVELKEIEEYEDHIYFGGALSERHYDAYMDTPSKKECDRISEKLSGEVITYPIKRRQN